MPKKEVQSVRMESPEVISQGHVEGAETEMQVCFRHFRLVIGDAEEGEREVGPMPFAASGQVVRPEKC
jgi:hypothetical protein